MDWPLFSELYQMFRGIFDAFLHMLNNIFGTEE